MNLIIILIFSATCSSILAQSIATNILFEEATSVFKGNVEDIMYAYGDDEKQEFSIQVRADTFYKGEHYDRDSIFRITTHRPRIIDTIKKEFSIEKNFQIKAGADYIFFTRYVRGASGDESLLFAQLVDRSVEALPYSEELVQSLSQFYKTSWIEANHRGPVAVRIMHQGSNKVTEGIVTDIKKASGYFGYEVIINNPMGESMQLLLKDLNCVCADGAISVNNNYLFFLNQVEHGTYVLSDRWMGIMQLNPLTGRFSPK